MELAVGSPPGGHQQDFSVGKASGWSFTAHANSGRVHAQMKMMGIHVFRTQDLCSNIHDNTYAREEVQGHMALIPVPHVAYYIKLKL